MTLTATPPPNAFSRRRRPTSPPPPTCNSPPHACLHYCASRALNNNTQPRRLPPSSPLGRGAYIFKLAPRASESCRARHLSTVSTTGTCTPTLTQYTIHTLTHTQHKHHKHSLAEAQRQLNCKIPNHKFRIEFCPAYGHDRVRRDDCAVTCSHGEMGVPHGATNHPKTACTRRETHMRLTHTCARDSTHI